MTVKKPHNLTAHEKETDYFVKRLIDFGLTENEANMYTYLLQRGTEVGGSKIAIGTGLHRQYVYIALEKLLEINLVEAVSHGKQKKYKARPPSELDKISRRRALEASDLVQDLNKISAINNDQDFEVLQGVKQIQKFEMDYVYESEKGEEEFIIGGYSKGFSDLMGDQLDEYLEEKSKKNIKVRYIGSDNEREMYKKYIGLYPNQEHRFMKELPQGVTHMLVRKNTVLFFSFLTPPLVYVTKSEVVAENYKRFFMMLWNMAQK